MNQIPRILLFIGALVILILSYDAIRPFLHSDGVVPTVVVNVPENKQDKAPDKPALNVIANPDRNNALSLSLSNELSHGCWAYVVGLPAPQQQGPEHDAVLLDIQSSSGALSSLKDRVPGQRYIQGVDDFNKYAVGPALPGNLTKGYGTIGLYDMRDSKKPRLVYSQYFPYHGKDGEYPSDWTSSQVIARELVITVHRWNEQAANLK